MQSKIYFGSSSGPAAEDKVVFHTTVLDADNISSKIITLPSVVDGDNISGFVYGGNSFLPTQDFSIAGADLDFTASSYAGTLVVGDTIQFIYKRV